MAEKIIVLTGNKIAGVGLLTLKAGLKLEVKGMKRHGRSCYSIIKEEFGFKGSKQSVLDQYTAALIKAGLPVKPGN